MHNLWQARMIEADEPPGAIPLPGPPINNMNA